MVGVNSVSGNNPWMKKPEVSSVNKVDFEPSARVREAYKAIKCLLNRADLTHEQKVDLAVQQIILLKNGYKTEDVYDLCELFELDMNELAVELERGQEINKDLASLALILHDSARKINLESNPNISKHEQYLNQYTFYEMRCSERDVEDPIMKLLLRTLGLSTLTFPKFLSTEPIVIYIEQLDKLQYLKEIAGNK